MFNILNIHPLDYYVQTPDWTYRTTGNTRSCHWCGVDLSSADRVTLMNGNLPVCDLCLLKAKGEK